MKTPRAEKQARGLVFLDFDGVICDSLPECYEASRLAWREYCSHETGPVAGQLPGAEPEGNQIAAETSAVAHSPEAERDAERAFRRLRPFIRRGGDYVSLQLCLARGPAIDSQAAFDAFLAELERTSPGLQDSFHELFYRARRSILAGDPDRWYALNPLYSGIAGLLRRHAHDENLYILSTKEAVFIEKILAYNDIAWDPGRILCSGKEAKLSCIDRVISARSLDHEPAGCARGPGPGPGFPPSGGPGPAAGCAVFVDDQPEHFAGSSEHPVRPLLADWGYVLPEWLSAGRYETLSLAGLADVLEGKCPIV